MVIQNNIPALNAWRHMGNNLSNASKALEKLSSGYKINRAADDATGLAVSEKMRSQIRGFSRAADNVMDGISMIQTADGALSTIQSILNRMTTLATQSANGVYENENDRKAANEEYNQLKLEIDDIAKNTNFNGIHMLAQSSGASGGSGSSITAPSMPAPSPGAVVLSNVTIVGTPSAPYTISQDTIITGNVNIDFLRIDAGVNIYIMDGASLTLSGATYNFGTVYNNGKILCINNFANDSVYDGAGTVINYAKGRVEGSMLNWNDSCQIINYGYIELLINVSRVLNWGTINQSVNFFLAVMPRDGVFMDNYGEIKKLDVGDSVTINHYGDPNRIENIISNNGTINYFDYDLPVVQEDVILQTGNTADETLTIKCFDLHCSNLGGNGTKLFATNISTEGNARAALSVIAEAGNQVSEIRGYFGALQNRLEYKYENLKTAEENLIAAESRIRDTDVAKEMMNFVKSNILIRSAQTMLAQANQLPQGILGLLR